MTGSSMLTIDEATTLIAQAPQDLISIIGKIAPDAPSPIKLPLGRTHMAGAFAVAGFHRGAEIGVWEGAFAEKICRQNSNLSLTCVDPWRIQPDYKEGKNDSARMEDAYHTATARLAPYHCTFLRMTSAEAAERVEDGSLDFVYIDGNHLFEHVMRDLQLWSKKVRRGGVVAGHDYGARKKHKTFIQVEEAVNQFTRDRSIRPLFVLAGDKSASFLWVVS
jgi:hypothetical protein